MPEQSKKQSQSLTIYLAKEGFGPTALLKSTKNLERYLIPSKTAPIGELYVQPARPKPPRWASFFEGHIDSHQLGRISSAAAVLIMKVKAELFAVTFGHGRHLLNPESWEERFGLRVALNCIGESNVRSIDKRTFDAISRHSREQASREATIRDFGLDIEQDLLRAVTGTSSDSTLGRRIYGMDALNVIVNAELETLPALLSRYHAKYLDTSYRKNFPWVDQIADVTNRSLHNELDLLLVDRIRSGELDRIWMAVPEIVTWELVSGFRFAVSHRSPEYHDIHVPDFLDSLRDPSTLTKDTLVHRQIHCIDNDGSILYKWPAYRCIYCELDHEGDSYLLSGGKWYRVTPDFVSEVNDAYRRIPKYTRKLPEYNDRSETDYNERIAKSHPSTFALMDRKNISYGGGYGQIEFCDLYTSGKDIVHIKRYGSSSVLSHLFSQGLVSGELFQTVTKFRKEVHKKLPPSHRFADVNQRPRPGQYQVVFAVISDAPGELVLPFFSRLNLKHAARRLEGYGFNVAVAKIPVNNMLSKLKRHR